jgi:enediyne biosynthesis protein E4
MNNQLDRAPALLRNLGVARDTHWVALKLIGGSKSSRDAVGATVYITAGKLRQRGDVISGSSFASSNDQREHFGLGPCTTVEQVEIHWPSGKVEKLKLPGVDRFYAIEEGKGIVPSVFDGARNIPSFRSAL